ncbi:MAG: polysaccharide biosynthesis protein [Actinobacteria bacterium]|nr:polysaccharide biosynthesis protein [Actinomycetota bacterium]
MSPDPPGAPTVPNERFAPAAKPGAGMSRTTAFPATTLVGLPYSPKMRLLLRRGAILAAVDAVCWAVGLGLVTFVRFDFEPARVDWRGLALVTAYAVIGQVAAGLLGGLYTGRLRFASFEEAGTLGLTFGAVGAALGISLITISGPRPIPLSGAAGGTGVAIVLAFSSRYLVRLLRQLATLSRAQGRERTLIFGAGEGGYEAARALLRDPETALRPVGFLDDEPAKQNLHILGSRVLGGRGSIAAVAASTRAETLVIAMPSASRAQIAEVAAEARRAGLRVLILPRMAKFLDTAVATRHIRPLSFADFLGRQEVHIDTAQVAGYLEGRRVLVTGAGGSIGSELCATISRFRPSALYMLDRDENALHRLQLRLEGRALLDSESLIVSDIRDREALDRVMERCRPEVVFHAAALKHVTFLERFPLEAVKTNVWGTLNVLQAAAAVGAHRFVNISTDKAADPICVLGFTKRTAEMLTANFASSMVGVSVRFGNVLGSQGSVIASMEQQIRLGGPVTITHPEVTRFFMTIEEAVQLVLQAGAVGLAGEVLVLDMGEPVRIVDLARELVGELDPGIDIPFEFTGLRPGEKLHEVLTGAGEDLLRRPHDLITAYAVPPLAPQDLQGLQPPLDDEIALSTLQVLASGTLGAASGGN